VRRISTDLRDDLALVEVSPPLPRHIYDTQGDLSTLILAARHQGNSLFSATGWPMAVYICIPKPGATIPGDTIDSRDLVILDWGEAREA